MTYVQVLYKNVTSPDSQVQSLICPKVKGNGGGGLEFKGKEDTSQKDEKESRFGKHVHWAIQKRQTLPGSSLSATPVLYTAFIYGDSSFLEKVLYLNSFRQRESQKFLLSPLFLKNHQPKIIHIPKRHIFGVTNSACLQQINRRRTNV